MAFFSSIGAAIFGAGTFLAAAATAVLKLAVGVGLNLLAQSLAGKPKEPSFSINGSLQGGGDLPRSIIFGEYSTAGSLVWANTWGNDGDTKNAFLTQVIALSDIPVKGLTGLYVNGEKVTFNPANLLDGSGATVPEYDNDGNNLWIKFYDGTQTVADSYLVNTCSNANRTWTANRVGRGVAYAIVTSRISKQMFSGMPTFKFVVDGARLYDPSRDSSVGGTGSQRLADPATWGGDGDYLPAVQMYNILIGVKYNNRWMYGFQGMSQARLPSANWIAQINKCRQPVSAATSGGTEPQYRSGMELPVDVANSGAFDALLTACQGRISDVGGLMYLFCGEPESPLVAFTDGDIISTTGQSFTPFFGLADSVNGMSAKWPSREDGWNVKTAPPLYRTDLEAQHGGRRLMADIELTAVPYAEQVQRLMRSALLEAQRARRHTITLPPSFWPYAVPGETIAWTSERNGYVNKLFRIDGVIDNANLDVMIDITEVDPSDYSWDSGSDFTPPVDGALGPMRPAPQPIIGFGAVADVAKDSNGNNRRCAIRLFWDGSLTGIDFVQYEVRLASDLSVVSIGRADEFARAALLIAPGTLLPNEDYQVRAKYGTFDGNSPFEWSSWIPVKTLDIRLGELDIYPIDVSELNKDVVAWQEWAGGSIRWAIEELDRIGQMATEQDVGNFYDKQILRKEMAVTAEGLTASYKNYVMVAVGPGSAIATRIEQLEVKVDNDLAVAIDSLTAQINTVDGRVTANADAITGLTVRVDGSTAEGLFRVTTEATPVGALSRISLTAAATAAGASSSAALFIEALAGGSSRVVVNADQFIVTNGTDSKVPLVFMGGELTLSVVNVGTAYFDTLQSRNGKLKMVGSGNNAYIEITA